MVMNIGTSEGKTAICAADESSVSIRGLDLCHDLMGKMSFSAFFCCLLTGKEPSDQQVLFVDAALLAIAEHGLTPSVQASRMTHAADPGSVQGAVAAGILGCGSVVLGTAEIVGSLLARGIEDAEKTGQSYADSADTLVQNIRAEKRKLPGFGHPLHKRGDPRCERLLELAEDRGVAGPHVAFARALKQAADREYQRPMVMNVSAAIPAVLLDLEFPLAAMKGIPILARTAGLLAHLLEESERPIGFHLSYLAGKEIEYDGPLPEDK